MGGTAAEIAAQDHLAAAFRSDGLTVEAWDIDVDELAARPDFPGMEVERASARGVLARWAGAGDGPTLLLLGHTDVVPPGDPNAWSSDPFVPRIDGDRLIGRGSCDMKAGTAAMWFAVRALRQAGVRLRGDILLAPVSGEEDGGLGTYALLQRGLHADACVIPEPTNLDIIPANGGALTFRLRVRGLATHASRRTEGVSAITTFVPVLEELQRLESRRNERVDPLMQRWPIAYPLSIGMVRSGDWASTVPDLLVAEGRLGVAIGETPEQARADLESSLARLCAGDPWLAEHPVQVEWWGGQFAPGLSSDAALVDLVKGAHRTAAPDAREQEVYGGPYGSDLRLLAPHMPVLQYGPGDARHAHAPIEQVRTDDMMTTARALVLAILAHCGTA